MSLDRPRKESPENPLGNLEEKLLILEQNLVDLETLMSSHSVVEDKPTVALFAEDQLEARENLLRAIKNTKDSIAQARRQTFRIVE